MSEGYKFKTSSKTDFFEKNERKAISTILRSVCDWRSRMGLPSPGALASRRRCDRGPKKNLT